MSAKRTLKRLEELARRRRAGRPDIKTIEVWDGDTLREVMPIPYRVYELDDAGRRVYMEPNEDDLELDAKIRKLVHGR